MPAISRVVAAATQDALTGLKFKTLLEPALVTLAISSATAGEDASFSVDSREFLSQGEINLEVANEVVDMERDVLLLQEVVPAGEMFLAIPVVAATVQFRLLIEPITGE